MVQSLGAQIGFLAFGLALVAGLYAGNSPTTILIRALLILAAGCLVGQVAGWAGKLILRDHLQHKKLTLDRAHREAVRALTETEPAPDAAGPADGG